jgi:hypothetical protein
MFFFLRRKKEKRKRGKYETQNLPSLSSESLILDANPWKPQIACLSNSPSPCTIKTAPKLPTTFFIKELYGSEI